MSSLERRENAIGLAAGPEPDLRHRVVKSLAWQSWASLVGQTIAWIATLFVIRLLEPSDYGLMASAGVLLGLLAAVSEFGVGAAVVQASELPRQLLRDVQALIWLLGACGGLVMAAAGGALAWFYSEPRLEQLAYVLALILPLAALSVLPQSLALRELRFDTKAFADLGASLTSATLTLSLAWLGAGVWSLVAGVIGIHAARAVIYAALQREVLLPSLSIRRARRFIRFGMLVSVDRLLWFLLGSIDVLIVGSRLGETTLGLYVVALTLASLPLDKIGPVVTQVSFPAFARIRSDEAQVQRSVVASVRYGGLVFVPIAWGAALVAPEALPWLLGERWSEAVFPFQLICLVLPLRALVSLVSPALIGTGRVNTNIVNLVVSLATMSLAYWIGSAYGLHGVALAWLYGYPLVFLVTTSRASRALGLTFFAVLRACRPAVVGGLAMVGAVSIVRSQLAEDPLLSFALAIPIGAFAYLVLLRLIEPGLLAEIRGLLSSAARAER